ncbi:hypothetical protein [Streptomyces sp. NPDC058335]|uniref:hypothetical protein n=1 Tax=Streptomyces sp. NPDC058335 TaxID=3346451 RepID=UPI003669F65C
MIIKVWRILVDHAGTLRVANLNAHYRQVWCLLGLDTLFPVSPTVQAALGPGWNGSAAGMTALPPRSGW